LKDATHSGRSRRTQRYVFLRSGNVDFWFSIARRIRYHFVVSLKRPGRGVEGYGLVNALIKRRDRSYISDRRLRFSGLEPKKLLEEWVEKGGGLGGGVGRGRRIGKADDYACECWSIRQVAQSYPGGR
jgi:hypothetical protein